MENEKIQLERLMDFELSCRAPSTYYNMYLMGRFLVFQNNSIITNKPFKIDTPNGFIEAYKACMNEEKDLLWELYQHNFFYFITKDGIPIVV